MNLTQWVHNTLKAAAEYIKGDKIPVATVQHAGCYYLPKIKFRKDMLKRKKKPKPRKKAKKKLKKAA